MVTLAATVRLPKFASRDAEPSVPTAPELFVGLVDPMTSYATVPVSGRATGPLCGAAKM